MGLSCGLYDERRHEARSQDEERSDVQVLVRDTGVEEFLASVVDDT